LNKLNKLNKKRLAIGTGAAAIIALAVTGGVTQVNGNSITPSNAVAETTEEFRGCDGYDDLVDDRICYTRGFIPSAFYHLTGSPPFCKWKKGNPGQWNKLNNYMKTGEFPETVGWMAASIKDQINLYLFNGGKMMPIPVNTAPNACR
jgi:hypothetical protein